jgi:hypothetical protein
MLSRLRSTSSGIAVALAASLCATGAARADGLGISANVGLGGDKGISADVDVGLGGSNGVNAGVDASVGGGSVADADVDASVGGGNGVNADADATVGGGSVADADVGVSIGGSGGSDDPDDGSGGSGGGSNGSGGGSDGSGGGSDGPGGGQNDTDMDNAVTRNSMDESSTPVRRGLAPEIAGIIGMPVFTSDDAFIGTVQSATGDMLTIDLRRGGTMELIGGVARTSDQGVFLMASRAQLADYLTRRSVRLSIR